MRLLELFAGSRSVGKVAELMGMEVFSVDIQAFDRIDLAKDILNITREDIPFIPDVIWASPPCTTFSVASVSHHWTIDKQPKTAASIKGVEILKKTLEIISWFPEAKYFIENPRGMMRKHELTRLLPRVTVMYCRYGDTRMKPTDIWSNHLSTVFNPDGWMPREECWNGNGNCHHEAAPRGSRTGTQGIKGAYDRSKIPYELVADILGSVVARDTSGGLRCLPADRIGEQVDISLIP